MLITLDNGRIIYMNDPPSSLPEQATVYLAIPILTPGLIPGKRRWYRLRYEWMERILQFLAISLPSHPGIPDLPSCCFDDSTVDEGVADELWRRLQKMQKGRRI